MAIDRSIDRWWSAAKSIVRLAMAEKLKSWKVVHSKRRRLFWAGWGGMHFHFVCYWRLQFQLGAQSSQPRAPAPDLSQSSRVWPRLMRCSCLPHRNKFIYILSTELDGFSLRKMTISDSTSIFYYIRHKPWIIIWKQCLKILRVY